LDKILLYSLYLLDRRLNVRTYTTAGLGRQLREKYLALAEKRIPVVQATA
jgi:hypothetical protein